MWTRRVENYLHLDEAFHGHYFALVVQLAVISTCIEYMWQIADLRDGQIVRTGKESFSLAMTLIGAEPEDTIRLVRQKVEQHFKELLDLEEVEKILLGE